MTTDDFTAAAQKSAAGKHPSHRNALPGDSVLDIVDAHVEGWKAARTYLAEQEPTDAEVREVWDALGPRVTIAMEYEDLRAALSAARSVRRDEEKR